MEQNQNQELDSFLDSFAHPNFVAFANGGFQLQSICAFFLHRQAEGEKLQGVVITTNEHLGTQDCAALRAEDVKFIHNYVVTKGNLLEKLKVWKKPRKNDQPPFYLIFMSKIHVNESLIEHFRCKYSDRPVVVVIASEGTQNFLGETPNAMGYYYAHAADTPLRKGVQYIHGWLVTVYKAAFLERLKNIKLGCYYSFLSQGKNKELYPKDPERVYLRFAFEKASAAKGVRIPRDYYKNTVLFCAQHFIEEDGLFDLEVGLLKECQEILQELGYRIMVKPHPADKFQERYKQIGLELDELGQNTSVEYLLAAAIEKPVAILSYGSTGMVTANLLWNIPGIALSKMIDIKKVNPHMTVLFSNLLDSFKQIRAPEDRQALEKCFHDIKCNS